jgi:hypothetical protein
LHSRAQPIAKKNPEIRFLYGNGENNEAIAIIIINKEIISIFAFGN